MSKSSQPNLAVPTPPPAAAPAHTESAVAIHAPAQARYKTVAIDEVDVFYREAGRAGAPALVLLHGFPTSSHMFRDLIPALAERYRVIAPDYPGFGNSGTPDRDRFAYTFENYAEDRREADREARPRPLRALRDGLRRAGRIPPGDGASRAGERDRSFRTATPMTRASSSSGIRSRLTGSPGSKKDREAIRWLTSLKATKWQYTHGVPDATVVSPDAWTIDQAFLDRPDNQEIQLDLFYDYRNNLTALSGLAGVFPRAPAADAGGLGHE